MSTPGYDYPGWPVSSFYKKWRGWTVETEYEAVRQKNWAKTRRYRYVCVAVYWHGGHCPVFCDVCKQIKRHIRHKWIHSVRRTNRIFEPDVIDGFAADVCPSCAMKFAHLERKIKTFFEIKNLMKELKDEVTSRTNKVNGKPAPVLGGLNHCVEERPHGPGNGAECCQAGGTN